MGGMALAVTSGLGWLLIGIPPHHHRIRSLSPLLSRRVPVPPAQ